MFDLNMTGVLIYIIVGLIVAYYFNGRDWTDEQYNTRKLHTKFVWGTIRKVLWRSR